jgi:putative N-acetyltransferase (TIGR04045 family)
MLEPTRPYGAPVRPYLAAWITYGVAREAWQARAYWGLRREIFCRETALFGSAEQERDVHDARALPIVATAHSACSEDGVVGIVRIYPSGSDVWYGGRLGVERRYRAHGKGGSGVIDAAVRCAIQHGCQNFFATVLRENAQYFERHHFRILKPLDLCGRPHVLMQAELSHFGALRCAA